MMLLYRSLAHSGEDGGIPRYVAEQRSVLTCMYNVGGENEACRLTSVVLLLASMVLVLCLIVLSPYKFLPVRSTPI